MADIKGGKGETLNEFCMGIYPRKGMRDRKGKTLLSTSKPYASVTYCSRDNTIVEESGFDTFPVAVHIWEPNGNSCYGTSPVIKVIDEFKRLNKMSEKGVGGDRQERRPCDSSSYESKRKVESRPWFQNIHY